MAVRKSTNHKSQITNLKPDVQEMVQTTKKECCGGSRWVILGWVLLLFGGLAHMLPEQMAPLMKWSVFGVSLQMAVGVVSVILALNFLLED